jgi:hypothetical protein
VGVARVEDAVIEDEGSACEDPVAALDEMAVADAALTTEGDEYVNPLIVESSVGEEARVEEEMDDVLEAMLDIVELEIVELDAAATVSAATTDGSLLIVVFDADDDAAIASAATAPTLEA